MKVIRKKITAKTAFKPNESLVICLRDLYVESAEAFPTYDEWAVYVVTGETEKSFEVLGSYFESHHFEKSGQIFFEEISFSLPKKNPFIINGFTIEKIIANELILLKSVHDLNLSNNAKAEEINLLSSLVEELHPLKEKLDFCLWELNAVLNANEKLKTEVRRLNNLVNKNETSIR